MNNNLTEKKTIIIIIIIMFPKKINNLLKISLILWVYLDRLVIGIKSYRCWIKKEEICPQGTEDRNQGV